MSRDPPYRLDMFQKITKVHFGGLYLVVRVNASNQSFNLGPYGVVAVDTVAVSATATKKGVKLLDVYAPPSGNAEGSGFIGCHTYDDRLGLEFAWIAAEGAGSFPPVDGSCPAIDPEDHILSGPVNYQAFATAAQDYLFSIPAGDGLVAFSAGGIMDNSDTGLDTSNYSQTVIGGSGNATVLVYSTVKGSIKKLQQLIDYNGDGVPRPTEDDSRSVGLDSETGGFTVSVRQDKNPADAQINNQGKTFQPYKVIFFPNAGVDNIPAQPPPFIP